uniref:Leucine-rich repeat-containing N-terminal plant-type domain-containing protein n=1 Tax=Chenopodium quinoa TaxID=63459 RepID=A0A803MUZ2_CHEQI
EALSAFKSNLVDPDGKLDNWNPSLAGPCTWHYVHCTDESVTELDLGSFKLTGQLVPQLGWLSNLKELALYNNNITGTIPPELENLVNLKRLDLSLNNLTGPIPDTLGNLLNLQNLYLEFSSLRLLYMGLSASIVLCFLAIQTLYAVTAIPAFRSLLVFLPL